MNNKVKSQKGITLIALVITIIVLLILATIGIRELTGNKNDIKQTRNALALAELEKVQQVVLETDLKYKQLGNNSLLIGDEVTYYEAEYELSQINPDEVLKGNCNPEIITNPANIKPEDKYYKLNKYNLKTLGMENISNDDEYIVNYSTGEVFNIKQKRTSQGEALYVYARTSNQGN